MAERGMRNAEPDVQARVGEWSRVLTTPAVLEAFAATLSYRLEPEGKGTRFPLLLDHLLAGRLEAAQGPGALIELETAIRELTGMPPSKVVGDLDDLRHVDDRGEPVAHGASDVVGYFIDRSGRPLVEVLREAIEECQRSGYPLTVDSGPVRGGLRRGGVLMGLGLLVSAAGRFAFPRLLIRPTHTGDDPHGLPLWSLGLVLLACGLWEIAQARSPAFAELVRRRPTLPLAVGLGLLALFVVLTWR